MKQNNEQKKGTTITLGGRKYELAPPVFGTLVAASEAMSQIPARLLAGDAVTHRESFDFSREWMPIFKVISLAVLGVREYRRPVLFLPWMTKGKLLERRLVRTAGIDEIRDCLSDVFEHLEIRDFTYLAIAIGKLSVAAPTKDAGNDK